MTSSDLLDTALRLQLTQAADRCWPISTSCSCALRRRALEHKDTPCIGRSHGMHAEPTTFGLKLAGFYAEFERNRRRLQTARAEVASCMISGAVGTFANVDPAVEAEVAAARPAPGPISTQVIPRDRHAAFFAALALSPAPSSGWRPRSGISSAPRSARRPEPFGRGQKGSSAMPHKRNPWMSENLCGLAGWCAAIVIPALENVALWHERDIATPRSSG